MSTSRSIDDLLIEKLHAHLQAEEYSSWVQKWYPVCARRLLDYCNDKSLAIESVRSLHIAQFLRQQYRLFRKRHGESPPFTEWRYRYTGAVRILLRLVHGGWPVWT
jgi:integrase/recombinase XerD